MSLDYVNVKIEPEPSFTIKNEENSNDAIYSKNALDISSFKKSKSIQNNDRQWEIQPEYVNIKTEIEIETTIVKQEYPCSGDEYIESLGGPNGLLTNSNEPLDCTKNGQIFDVEIKQEPFEINCINTESKFLIENPNNQTTDDEVAEKLLNLNALPDGKYMCPICQKRFASKNSVRRHQLLHTKEKNKCDICSKTFITPDLLKKHMLSHSNDKTYNCKECGKTFRTTSNLGQHRKTHLAVKPFSCQVCHRQFAVKANLIKHQGKSRCKQPRVPIVCEICDKEFQKEFLLRSHLRRHTTEKPFTCENCKMNFKYKSTLIRHIQLHNGIKPYSCTICTKTFTHPGLIKPHMRKHTGEKPYMCPICNKLFAHKHNMERHALRHAKVKNLDCPVCLKKFPKESRLRYHMRTHTHEKPFPCKVCPKKFSHKQNALRHYARKHPGQVYSCVQTDASVAREVWDGVVQKKIGFKVEPVDLEQPDSDDEYVIP